MDTFSMKCFLCVAQRLNLSKAADAMGISQPAMSAQIKKMELELGVPLFVRDTHTVALTAAGRIVEERFRKILADCGAMMEELEALKRRRERLHIGWNGPTNWAGIQDLLYYLMREHAAIYAKSKMAPAEELCRDLETGALDAAFLEKGRMADSRQYRSIELFRDTICFGVTVDNPLSRKASLSPEDIRNQKIFYKTHDYAQIKDIVDMLTKVGVPRENLFSVEDLDISVVTAMDEGGLVVFPSSFKLVDNRTVAYLDLVLPDRPICYCLVWRADNNNPQLPRFIKCCRNFHWPGQEQPGDPLVPLSGNQIKI